MVTKSKVWLLIGLLMLLSACAKKGPVVSQVPPKVAFGSGNGDAVDYAVVVSPNLAQSLGLNAGGVCAQVLAGNEYVAFSSGPCTGASNVQNSSFMLGLSSQDDSSYFLNDTQGYYVGEMDWDDDQLNFTLQYLCTGEFAVNGSGGPSIPNGGAVDPCQVDVNQGVWMNITGPDGVPLTGE